MHYRQTDIPYIHTLHTYSSLHTCVHALHCMTYIHTHIHTYIRMHACMRACAHAYIRALHCITCHLIWFQLIALHRITSHWHWHCTTLHYTTTHHFITHYMTPHSTTLHYLTHRVALHYKKKRFAHSAGPGRKVDEFWLTIPYLSMIAWDSLTVVALARTRRVWLDRSECIREAHFRWIPQPLKALRGASHSNSQAKHGFAEIGNRFEQYTCQSFIALFQTNQPTNALID